MEIVDNVTQEPIYQVGNVLKTDEGPALICSYIDVTKGKQFFSVSLENGAMLSDIFDSLEDLSNCYGDPDDRLVKATLTIERH